MVNTDVVTQDVVSCKCGEHLDTAWMGTLEGVPALVGALDATAIRCDVLTRPCEAPLSDVFKLFTVGL